IHRVDGRVLERQGLTEVVHYRRDPRGQAFCTGDVAELIECNATEVSRNHPEALRGEMKSIASMTGRQLELMHGARLPERPRRIYRRSRWARPVHARMFSVGVLPMPALCRTQFGRA